MSAVPGLSTMNSCFLVGHIEQMPVSDRPGPFQRATMKIRCTRPYAEADGSFVEDLFSVSLWRGIADDTCSTCKAGDPVAVKGRLIMQDGQPIIVAEHVYLPAGF